jgi:hypothetical protein
MFPPIVKELTYGLDFKTGVLQQRKPVVNFRAEWALSTVAWRKLAVTVPVPE